MLSLGDFVWGGILPGAAAALALAGVWRLTRQAASAWRTAVVLGYVVGHWALAAQNDGLTAALVKSYHPTEARDWLPLLVLLAIVPAAVGSFGRWPAAAAWVLRLGLCVFLPWRLLQGSVYLPSTEVLAAGFASENAWSTGVAVLWLGGLAVALAAVWLGIRSVDRVTEVWLRSILTTLVPLAAAVATGLSGSFSLAQLFGVLTATCAGAGLASAVLKTKRGPSAAAGPLLIAFGGVLLLACFFAELKIIHAALLLLALYMATGRFLPSGEVSLRTARVTRTVLCLTALTAAIGLTVRDFRAAQAAAAADPYAQFLK